MSYRLRKNLAALYGAKAPARLAAAYRQAGGPFRFLRQYWTTQHFDSYEPDRSATYRPVRLLLAVGMAAEILAGLALTLTEAWGDRSGLLYVGLAVMIATPLVWAHLLFLFAFISRLLQPKIYGKHILCTMLESQVKTLRDRNEFTLIAVVGSVGKTSTKLSIARTLAASGKRVQFQEGNYNDRLTVPLVFFGAPQPSIFNLPAWLKLLLKNQRQLRRAYGHDVVVVELGIDGPGQMKDFAYLHPELSVVTAVSEEHMEYFKTLQTVAEEELKVFSFSKQVLVNTDDVAPEFLGKESFDAYGFGATSYNVKLVGAPTITGQQLAMKLQKEKVELTSLLLGHQGAKIVLAAAAVAHMIGISKEVYTEALATLRPFAGRMQLLNGIEKSTIIDDSYNSSPKAVRAGLDVLYGMEAPQRIAILGTMNEMGELSAGMHADVGAYCNPDKLDLVLTIGDHAGQHLAPAAQKAGCRVKSFKSPRKAGLYAKKQLKKGAIIFVKGSQNRVFAEEAIKPLLQDPADAAKLVRQSAYWMKIKKSQFGA